MFSSSVCAMCVKLCVLLTVVAGAAAGDSGAGGKLRVCIVEGRKAYRPGSKYCPILDQEDSGVECVIGVDRLDCLRRIHKGSVDFGVFSPEDLVAAQWFNVEVLVVNEIRKKQRPFARSVVAVANKNILREGGGGALTPLSAVLRGAALCHPAADADDLRPLSQALATYLESLVTENQCEPSLSLVENRIKATAAFFRAACMAGPWVTDPARDAQLKQRYPSLCAACESTCSKSDRFWGDTGALNCLAEGAGDVTWADLDDARQYFKSDPNAEQYSLLCGDGSSQPLNATSPCVWLHQPWNIIVAKRKSAEAVNALTASLHNGSALVDAHWRGALASLLRLSAALPAPLRPPRTPRDYLADATGFTEAYSQHGCNPPRHITLCTRSLLENNKCEWLGEAGAVHGVTPPLQCARRDSAAQCLAAVQAGDADAALADGDWHVIAQRNYSLVPILHEATPIINEMRTISAYVRKDSGINKISDLRQKRAAFPSFDGVAWHSVLRFLTRNQRQSCQQVANTFFSSICAPGVENYTVAENIKTRYTANCYKEGDNILSGEAQALRSVVESKSDVAFISRTTYSLYRAKHFTETWAKELVELVPVCPDESNKYCFLSWSNIGHVYSSSNLTDMRRQEIVNVLTGLDQLFGNHAQQQMFSMYGPFNHQLDVLFHNNTKSLLTDQMFQVRPYNEIPLNFELSLMNASNICTFSDFTTGFGAAFTPAIVLVWSLVFAAMLVNY